LRAHHEFDGERPAMRRGAMDRGLILSIAGAALVCVLVGALAARALSRLRARLRGRASNTRGQRGERAAEALLEAHGFRLIARQIETSYAVEVDGATLDVPLHADFLVARGSERLIAEVKTGRNAPRFQHAETRRQLLEYQLAFAVGAVLLVDVEAGRLREVRFPLSDRAPAPIRHGWWVACVAAGLLAYWLAKP
jgi:hypothetical protein